MAADLFRRCDNPMGCWLISDRIDVPSQKKAWVFGGVLVGLLGLAFGFDPQALNHFGSPLFAIFGG